MTTRQYADLARQKHLSRHEIENYTFLRETGSSHEEALARSGMTERMYWRHRKVGRIAADVGASRGREIENEEGKG